MLEPVSIDEGVEPLDEIASPRPLASRASTDASQELRDVVLAALHRVAPEEQLGSIDPNAELRDQVELDSMDFLSLVDELHTRTGVDIPERDYPLITSVARCEAYLAARLRHTAQQG
jgi:acyl carrier protein